MKKVLSAVLAALMLVSVLSIGLSAEIFVTDNSFSLGNADGDEAGAINAQDLNLMKSYLLGNEAAISAVDSQAADLEADGKISASDIYYIKQLMTGQITAEAIGGNKATAKLQIAGNDISEYALVVPVGHDESKNTYYSAQIFNKYLKNATGLELPIVNDGSWTGKKIEFHQYSPVSEEGKVYGTESYKYEVVEGNLNVYGTYRGNMYAVYEILENYLGVRFFDDQYSFAYKQRYVNIEEGLSVFVEPMVKFRFTGPKVSYGSGIENYYYPSRMNGTQIYRNAEEKYGFQYGPQHVNAHSYDLFWQYSIGTMPEDDGTMTLEQRYLAKLNDGIAKAEAEFGKNMVINWQPCASNEDSYNTMFEGMLICMARLENWNVQWYAFSTDAKEEISLGQKSMSFSLCDNEKYCTCRYCKNTANGWTDRSVKPPVKYPAEGWAATYLQMANKAAVDIQEYYPGMRIHCILYNHAIPATIKPDKNVIVWYCGQGCNNHNIQDGPEACGDCKGQLNKESNKFTKESLIAWGNLCKETGAEMWYWYYGVTYHYYLVDMPNVTNLYYDYNFMFNECNVSGFYYESGGRFYGYSGLKAYLVTKLCWNPNMTYEQYIEYMKEYLYMYYGNGYELIYEYIMILEEAGNRCGTCFVSNFDRPGDMYSYAYIAENDAALRALLKEAYDMAERDEQKTRIETMQVLCEFLTLSSLHTEMYVEGDAESKAEYEERYTWFYNTLKEYNMDIFSDPVTYTVPAEIDFEINPMIQFYEDGSRRPNVYP